MLLINISQFSDMTLSYQLDKELRVLLSVFAKQDMKTLTFSQLWSCQIYVCRIHGWLFSSTTSSDAAENPTELDTQSCPNDACKGQRKDPLPLISTWVSLWFFHMLFRFCHLHLQPWNLDLQVFCLISQRLAQAFLSEACTSQRPSRHGTKCYSYR